MKMGGLLETPQAQRVAKHERDKQVQSAQLEKAKAREAHLAMEIELLKSLHAADERSHAQLAPRAAEWARGIGEPKALRRYERRR